MLSQAVTHKSQKSNGTFIIERVYIDKVYMSLINHQILVSEQLLKTQSESS